MIATSFGFCLDAAAAFLQDFHLAIDAQHFGHLFRKVGIALFQVVSHFVRLHLFLVEDFAHRALRQVGEAPMPLRRSMLGERGWPEAASSTVRGDSQGPSPSGTPTTPAMPCLRV